MITDKLVSENASLIYEIAKKFYGAEKEDLFQAGVVGLLKAMNNYHDSSAKFSTYAYKYIYGEMYNLVFNKPIKFNREVLNLFRLIEKTRGSLAQKLGKVPNNNEIAEFLEMDVTTINEAIMAGMNIMSLDNESDMPFYETIKVEENTNIDEKILIDEGLELLSKDEKEIIKSRYYEDLTQSEVAKKLAMTQVMVSRYEKKGLNKMQAFMQR